jgi:hypothetical protein
VTLAHWNLLAEVLGFLSGVLLLVPTFSLNQLLRDVETARSSFQAARTRFGKAVGEAAAPTLQEARMPKWSERDQGLLQLGALLLALSFLIKVIVALQS